MTTSDARVLVVANCTHYSLALALRKSGLFGSVASAELYSMTPEERERLAQELDGYDYILTLEHGDNFGALATSALRQRLGKRVVSLPTPFFSGTVPEMAYLRYGTDIARTAAVMGDYHSGLVLADVQSGFSAEQIVDRYVSGKIFDRLDVEGVWQDSMAALKEREQGTDIALTPFIEQVAANGTISDQFLSFNHPTEDLINYIAGAFIKQTLGGQDSAHAFVSQAEHNLYADAFWPLHPVVAARLGLPPTRRQTFKQPNRLGGAELTMEAFVRGSVAFFTEDKDPAQFQIATPGYLTARIAPLAADGAHRKTEQMSKATPKNIIMTHFGRSGSTVLANLLKQNSKLAWLDEYFSLRWINAKAKSDYNYTLDQLLEMIASETEKRHATKPGVMVGHEIKLMNFLQNPSCNMVDYARACADPEKHVHIVLRRRNTLKRICSLYKARDTKVYHVTGQGPEEYRKKTFEIDFSKPLVDYDTGQKGETFPELIANAQKREDQVLTNYRHLGIQYLELSYEDDIEADPKIAYGKVVDYLGIDPEPAEVTLSKTSTGLRQELLNYDALEQAMKNSPYEWMLDD
ncbi:MAG: WcbI family polysaccharide biosynthesis putative acetyltransferase [Paracoccaceae bacterium]|nr:WcbI family polysaccharide biosynthesis putative acetyltransferase [Paracoccaceae bacterium]